MVRTLGLGLGIVAACLLACKQGDKDEGSAAPTVVASAETAATPAPPASERAAPATADNQAPATRSLTDDEIAALKRSMASGTKVVKEQSFAVDFKDIGECHFVSALAPNEREFVFFVFRNGKVYKGLLSSSKVKQWMPVKVTGVTFKDVDGDGFKDIVVVALYTPRAGIQVPAALVYMRRGVNFKLDEARSDKAAAAGNDVNRAARLAR